MEPTPTHWKLIRVRAETIDLQRLAEESNSRICIVQECDDNGKAFEVAVEPSYLAEVQELQSHANLPYNPTNPREAEKAILGICQANRKARERWLQRAVDVIFSKHRHEIKEAYRNLTELLGLQRELDRKILIQDISDSLASVRRKLARNLVFLFLNLEADHMSADAQIFLESNEEELIDSLKFGLKPPTLFSRDECQITSLFRALLALSSGRVDFHEHNFAENYTAKQNSELCARVFDISVIKKFGEFDQGEISSSLSKSPIFVGENLSAEGLGQWAAIMSSSLQIAFPPGHLNLPQQILSRFGVGHIKMFETIL
ncbi:hypothetical protein HRR83_004044 [Exophiala dermatitidis]|uniref:Uncharacterized protein n=1 Tax=Exophiala dermatitidis TaxID=5970 RepID=A0AAN6IQF2_EXODE|nr:hypothetical protein HRR73_007687 [Exophiala dermatitidis]KAJ4521653.1 hypothetical protein HRR74_003478 [Exophiala dermatitidis]KAJ4531771.1 hypothetical protein HRR77_009180 [Exophiala dermatitidis]KAJ4545074.1 hypothetical protein HRR76_003104 [Exophiala dermatitidis]KAJ4554696.1 hypothetical protein HRR79_009410 [Exophiala dermatitidis]